MKKIYEKRVWARFANWSVYEELGENGFVLADSQPEMTSHYVTTFKEVKNLIENKCIPYAHVHCNLLNKQTLRLYFMRAGLLQIPERNFAPIEFRVEYEEVSHYTIMELANMLTADQFCEYVKDRGITIKL